MAPSQLRKGTPTSALLDRKIVVPAFSPNGEMNVQSIKDLQQWYVDNGFVQNPVPLDEFFDTSYLDYALSVVGRR